MRTDSRLRLINTRPFFGPGTATLLEAIAKSGCVRLAAEDINLSYSKARKMLSVFKEETGEAAVITGRGGIGGGSAVLTEYAISFLDAYRKWEEECNRHQNELFSTYFGALL